MTNSVNYARSSVVLALLLVGMSSFFCAVCHFGVPIQQIETRAELLKSQSTGMPISDTDISTHLGRLSSVSRFYGVACGLTFASGVAMIAALVLLPPKPSLTKTP